MDGISEPIYDAGVEIVTVLKFGMGKWEGHHVIPKYIQKRLQVLLNQVDQWDLDDVAVSLETRPDHWFPNGLHANISGNGLHWGQQINGINDAGDIIQRLVAAYENAIPPRLDLAEVVRAWASAKNISF